MIIYAVFFLLLLSCAHHAEQKILPSSTSLNNFAVSESWMRLADDQNLPSSYYLCQRGEIKKGLKFFSSIAAANIHEKEINGLGICYYLQSDYIKADYFYSIGITTYPKSALLLNNYAILLASTGQNHQAKELFSRAKELAPNMKSAKYNLALLHFNYGQYDLAERELSELIRMAPQDPLLYQVRAMVYVNKAQFTNAIKDFNKVNEKQWIDQSIVLHYSYSLLQINQKAKAHELFELAGKLKPSTNKSDDRLRLWLENEFKPRN